ncbi:VWA domain-containing protein [Thalassomonas sp. M1454]|uniref:VWA domain-containing protein n=1 Tax=Thalassomonas sp. M1454 TaxID=2594477 RepID=UPI00117D5B08|nr:VWA domain-containing protein [Thalassomonas sp. M1454]TRX54937.1 VWA domain-containing protein [Thalassomonas sp. M1454]
MIELAYPWALALLVLPVIVYFALPAYKEQRDSLQVPYFKRLVKVSGEQPRAGAVLLKRNVIQKILLFIGWIALVFAIAKPEFVGEPIELKKSAREIMVALDLSGSMSEQDFTDKNGKQIDRLAAAKIVLNDFASQRQSDRLGLILFGDSAYLQAPFTDDIPAWQELLNDTQLGYAGFFTAFGDAIGLSIATFEQEKSKQRVLILLTDGEDTGSKMPPIKAAEIAAKHDIKIYTIAVGDPSSKGIYKMDLPTLEKIAKITNGASFQAINQEELQQAYKTINELEEQQYESLSFRPRTSVHHWAFAVYFIANLLVIFIYLLGQVGKKVSLSRVQEQTNKGDAHG